MGVTIHFEGKVKGAITYSLLVDELRESAANNNWKCEELAKSNAVLKRIRDEKPWDYSGPTLAYRYGRIRLVIRFVSSSIETTTWKNL